MEITINFSNFEPWSGAVSTWETIENEVGLDALESYLDEIYNGEPIAAGDLNDMLWFESEDILKALGILTESAKEELLNDALNEMTDINNRISEIDYEIQDEEDEDEIQDLTLEQEELENDLGLWNDAMKEAKEDNDFSNLIELLDM